MNKTFTFDSPFSAQECRQRLEALVGQTHFYFAYGRFKLHLNLLKIEFNARTSSFTLYAQASPQRFDLPAILYFELAGHLQPEANQTKVRFELHMRTPFAKADKMFLLFWSLIVLLAIVGGVIGVLTAAGWESAFIAALFVLGGLGYAWILQRVYKLTMMYLPSLVYQVIGPQLSTSTQSESSSVPDWVANSSKSL